MRGKEQGRSRRKKDGEERMRTEPRSLKKRRRKEEGAFGEERDIAGVGGRGGKDKGRSQKRKDGWGRQRSQDKGVCGRAGALGSLRAGENLGAGFEAEPGEGGAAGKEAWRRC